MVRLLQHFKHTKKTNGVYERNYLYRINIMKKIFDTLKHHSTTILHFFGKK